MARDGRSPFKNLNRRKTDPKRFPGGGPPLPPLGDRHFSQRWRGGKKTGGRGR